MLGQAVRPTAALITNPAAGSPLGTGPERRRCLRLGDSPFALYLWHWTSLARQPLDDRQSTALECCRSAAADPAGCRNLPTPLDRNSLGAKPWVTEGIEAS